MDESEVRDSGHPTPDDQVEWEDLKDVYRPPMQLLEKCLRGLKIDPPIVAARPPLLLLKGGLLQELREIAKSDIRREHGGVLYGLPFEDPSGRFFVFVLSVIPAPSTSGSAVYLRFNESSWQEIWNKLPNLPDQVLVGWYHTHPGLGVFMSGTDRRTHALYFPHFWQVAVVIDPLSDKIGFFYGSSGQRLDDVRTFSGDGPLLAGRDKALEATPSVVLTDPSEGVVEQSQACTGEASVQTQPHTPRTQPSNLPAQQ